MKQLRDSHPHLFDHMMNGGFVVRRSPTFNCIPTDQAVEHTINQEAKSEGCIIGFTLSKGALLRWLLTRHVSGRLFQVPLPYCTHQ